MAPMDVFEAGRMIVVQDAVGAVVMFWQPLQHIGAEVRDEHGALTWTLMMTNDKDASASFYSDLLGIEVAKDAMPSPDGGTVHMLMVDGAPVATIMNHAAGSAKHGHTASLGGLLQGRRCKGGLRTAVNDNGGQVYMGPADLGPMGTIGYMQDPQGAQFGVQSPPAG